MDSDDSSCDNGDPNYADWLHDEPSMPKDNLDEDEMLRCTFADRPNSEILEEFVERLRESKKTLDYEVQLLRMCKMESTNIIKSLRRELDEEKEKKHIESLRRELAEEKEKNKQIESLRRELVEEKERNKQIESRECFNSFV